MKQDTLQNRIWKQQPLSETEIEEIIEAICYKCHAKTINRIRRVLERVPHIESYGIYGRVHLDSPANYCVGQDSNTEIPTVRRLLLNS
jgi:hypothetical protein